MPPARRRPSTDAGTKGDDGEWVVGMVGQQSFRIIFIRAKSVSQQSFASSEHRRPAELAFDDVESDVEI